MICVFVGICSFPAADWLLIFKLGGRLGLHLLEGVQLQVLKKSIIGRGFLSLFSVVTYFGFYPCMNPSWFSSQQK